MTVIAYDHKRKTISVDSLQTQGDMRAGRAKKYTHLPDGGMAFGAGTWSGIKRIFMALEKSETPPAEDFADCTIILVRGGKVYELDGSPTPERVMKSWAWGCGKPYAIGALLAGATSEQAAKIAAELDVYCGGPVNTFEV